MRPTKSDANGLRASRSPPLLADRSPAPPGLTALSGYLEILFGSAMDASISAQGRLRRNLTHPALGTRTSPHLRLSFLTDKSLTPKPSFIPAFLQVG